jgi:hypothetical protein
MGPKLLESNSSPMFGRQSQILENKNKIYTTFTNTTHVLQNKRDNEFTFSKNLYAHSIYLPFRQ